MQEQIGELPHDASGLGDSLEQTLRQRNRDLAEYFDHWATAGACANEIRQLAGAASGTEAVMATLADIEASLDVIHGYCTELGHIPEHNGDFDADSLAWVVIERNIGNGRIRTLDDIPEALRDDFRYLFEGDELLYVERPRESAAISADLRKEREALDLMLARPHDFSGVLCEGASDPGELRTELNTLWDEFRSSARAAARYF